MTFKTADLSDANDARVQAVLPGLLNFEAIRDFTVQWLR
jgi:hypothetical protein